MTNQINLNVLSDILRKGTLDLAVQMIQIQFKNSRMIIKMISGPRNVITILNLENNMINFSEHDDVTLNFGGLTRPLQTIDTIQKFTGMDVVSIEIFDGEENPRLVFKPTYNLDGKQFEQRHTNIMCDESVMDRFLLGSKDYDELPVFAEFTVTPDLLNLFYQISAHAGIFGKIYFRLNNGVLSIDATDENNIFEDKHDCDLAENVESENMAMCFDFDNFTHLLNVIKSETSKENPKTYKIGFTWIQQTSGVIRVFSKDNEESEEYMLLNREL